MSAQTGTFMACLSLTDNLMPHDAALGLGWIDTHIKPPAYLIA